MSETLAEAAVDHESDHTDNLPGSVEELLAAGDEEAYTEVEAEDSADQHSGDKPVRQAPKSNKALIRRVASKAVEVQDSEDTVREATAALLGCGTDPIELTTAIMTANRSVREPITDVNNIAETVREDPFEAGVTVLAMGRARLKGVWTLLSAIGALPESIPAADTKMATAVVKAVHLLDDTQALIIETASELLKRS